ncbi:hypothetical protein PFISCL1PPCAC_22331, partial [Pristionchus fissidentatus]
MSSSDYAEEKLSRPYELPPKVQETAASVARIVASNGAILSGAMTGKGLAANYLSHKSSLQKWCEQDSWRRLDSNAADCPELAERFPLMAVVDNIVSTMANADVLCLIAPTGCGKSILAPYIADRVFHSHNHSIFSSGLSICNLSNLLRKTMLCVPSNEHCGSTVRCFNKFFLSSGIVVKGYLNPYELAGNRGPIECKGDMEADAVVVSYNTAMRVLAKSQLGMLILDEIHDANDNVQVTVAMALKKLMGSSFSLNDSDK